MESLRRAYVSIFRRTKRRLLRSPLRRHAGRHPFGLPQLLLTEGNFMLKRLLLSGAALTALATFAMAQSAPPPADVTTPPAATAPASPAAVDPSVKADPNLYTNLQGADVLGENDQSIGSVADLLLAPSGDLRGLVIAHGGIVGIGQTYRNYEVSALPEVNNGKVKIGDLNTAALEGIPEYAYPEAETGRASTDGAAPAAGNETKPAPADASAASGGQLWPASYLVGATVTNAADKAKISDLRFEGNKVAAVLLDKGSLGLGNKVQEIAFEDLEISGSPAEPQIALKAGSPGLASDPAPQSSSAPAGAPTPAAP
jgi:hypothetical protein